MTHANIITLVDLQNGFARFDIPQNKGGCLYVPGGENAAEPAAELTRRSKNTIFILTQDFHPEDHISFMENHHGVMDLRREQLKGKAEPGEMEAAVLNPLRLPFTNILVKKYHNAYAALACDVDGQWRKVETNYYGNIAHVTDELLEKDDMEGSFVQTLWRSHCVRNTESAQFDPKLTEVLPEDLRRQLADDWKSPILESADGNGNTFFVVRKGMRLDLDSYGIATENDGISQTAAPQVFALIAERLKKNGATHADIDIGGLATNFCAEFSEKDVHAHLVPTLEKAGIGASVHFLTDISYGIPIAVPDGSWPDLAGTEKRMKARGTDTRTTEDLLRAALKPQHGLPERPRRHACG